MTDAVRHLHDEHTPGASAPRDHDHGRHRHAAAGRPSRAVAPGFSLLRASLSARLAIASALVAAIWAGVFWAMA